MSRTAAQTLRAEGPDEVVRVPRRLDARLLVPVVVAWPVVAFVGLVVPTAWVWWSALASGGLGSALMVLGGGCDPPAEAARADPGGARAATLLAVAGHRTVRDVGPLAELAEARAVVTVVGVIATEPVVIGGPLVGLARTQPASTRNRPVTPSSWSGWTSGRWRAAGGSAR